MIGRGGMGNVYAAEHQATGHQVAVKLISAHVADEPRFRRRFEKEIHALKLLKHPGIVRLIGYGEENGQLFYSMELVVGETLQTRIRREKRLSPNETIDIAIQICAALKHAHDIGVQHRDLKPANLMLTGDDKVKLVDFGIPKNYWDSSEETGTGSVLGTPDYMAPEQADDGTITARTDLYSLGSVMYAMLAGRSPFKGKNATAVIEALRREKPIPLSMIASDAPEELCELVHQLLEKVAGDRPPTALVVMNRLKAMKEAMQSKVTQAGNDEKTRSGEPGFDGSGKANQDASANRSDAGANSSVGSSKSGDKTIVSVNDKTRLGQTGSILGKEKDAGVGSESPTLLSQPNSGGEEATSTTRTHFETVDHSKPTSTLLRPDDLSDHVSSKVSVIASAVAIIALIGVLGWAMVTAITPPTSDQLYQSAIVQGDIDAAEAFLMRYPDDDRVAAVVDFRMQHRLRSTLNRLKATEKIGLKKLGAAETSFLSAMSERESVPGQDGDQDSNQAGQKLRQWLAAFGDAEDGNPAYPLVELARYELDQINGKANTAKMDPRAKEVLNEIQAAIALQDPAATEAKLRAIVATFTDESWAAPALDQALRWLEARDNATMPD
ncbi:Serine/threonine-protein kinase PknB [Rubripirellula obstinata]|uniref:Serine/threonine-protein kinase PknB n=2 Tax=Rubripirellula obstinata TaxID=406547 RepID=A0A5B1CCA8_9BACT|nr:Serine/threonine-protein kinase PknB [Rubripirellula obstinata]